MKFEFDTYHRCLIARKGRNMATFRLEDDGRIGVFFYQGGGRPVVVEDTLIYGPRRLTTTELGALIGEPGIVQQARDVWAQLTALVEMK